MNFCIITGINYLAKAITMYESLIATGVSFDIYYVCFDKQTYRSLKQLNYPHIIPIALAEVEDPELKKAKKTRSRSEYFFTLTPSIVLYTMKICSRNFSVCTYSPVNIIFRLVISGCYPHEWPA